MKLKCKKTRLGFTRGKIYYFEEPIDPPGHSTKNDFDEKVVFFNTNVMFKKA